LLVVWIKTEYLLIMGRGWMTENNNNPSLKFSGCKKEKKERKKNNVENANHLQIQSKE